uniref:ATP synthase complex subunit 8 n=2 Tax=Syngnathinae TaxID=129914 RepID=A0A7D5KNE3_MICDA|nr:ATP synthase F0 subunit 8 [Oostethus manadensis]YP_009914973.1 ATP synthase F0 subunit 8 [Microphis deocata]AKG95375.1 ATP synthase F0 subunit 8 [Oostethus manadensis]QLF67684.1 ATP synthase F0 subunit 8 [Microphis deocata]
MPQLNPSPWFVVLLFSWAVLMTIVPLKISNHKFPNTPTLTESKPAQNKFWPWPWH